MEIDSFSRPNIYSLKLQSGHSFRAIPAEISRNPGVAQSVGSVL